jgi:hypothetical protein
MAIKNLHELPRLAQLTLSSTGAGSYNAIGCFENLHEASGGMDPYELRMAVDDDGNYLASAIGRADGEVVTTEHHLHTGIVDIWEEYPFITLEHTWFDELHNCPIKLEQDCDSFVVTAPQGNFISGRRTRIAGSFSPVEIPDHLRRSRIVQPPLSSLFMRPQNVTNNGRAYPGGLLQFADDFLTITNALFEDPTASPADVFWKLALRVDAFSEGARNFCCDLSGRMGDIESRAGKSFSSDWKSWFKAQTLMYLLGQGWALGALFMGVVLWAHQTRHNGDPLPPKARTHIAQLCQERDIRVDAMKIFLPSKPLEGGTFMLTGDGPVSFFNADAFSSGVAGSVFGTPHAHSHLEQALPFERRLVMPPTAQ